MTKHEHSEEISESGEEPVAADLRKVVFEKINDDHAYGKLGPIKLIINLKTGYFSAAKLCSDSNKRFNDWFVTKQAKEIIRTLSETINVPSNEIVIYPKGLRNELKGYFAHPKLATHLATWCNPSFGLIIDDIVVGYYTDKIELEKARLIQEKELQLAISQGKIDRRNIRIKRKDKKINTLIASVNNLQETNNKQSKDLKTLIDICQRQGVKIDDQTTLLHNQNEKLDDFGEALDAIAQERVPRGHPSHDNTMCIGRKNVPNDKKGKDYYAYVVFRTLKKNIKAAIKNKKKLYPQMTIICEIDYTPNAMHLWKQYLDLYGNNITRHGTEFNRNPGYTEAKLIRHINKAHDARLDY